MELAGDNVHESLSSRPCGQFNERVKDVEAKPSVLNSMWVMPPSLPYRLEILEQPQRNREIYCRQ